MPRGLCAHPRPEGSCALRPLGRGRRLGDGSARRQGVAALPPGGLHPLPQRALTFSDGDFHAVRFPDDPEAGPDHGRREGAERARLHPLRAQSAYSDDRETMFPPNPTSPEDEGRFLTPSLRGVALTAPYGHAGTLPTLEAVIDLYAAGGAPSVIPTRVESATSSPSPSRCEAATAPTWWPSSACSPPRRRAVSDRRRSSSP